MSQKCVEGQRAPNLIYEKEIRKTNIAICVCREMPAECLESERHE